MSVRSFVGLEIHVQLLTQTKIFCGCRASFGDEPNTNVCPVCLGYPGALPVLNRDALQKAYIIAKALNCTPAPAVQFDRKNYFYPDLPKNYQISQFAKPVGRDGYIDIEFHNKKRRVRIHECHLEEDAGKMIHAGDISLLDYNRAGTPLVEIVTEPDLEIGEEAEVLIRELRRMVRYLGVSDGNMEEASLRCDANVSVSLTDELGSKVEIKNLNSSRFVRKALNHEIERQREIVERGGGIRQETRLWNENRDVTETMRVKESAQDYRYFPEPDMPQFDLGSEFFTEVDAKLVELPAARRNRFVTEYGISEADADFVCEEKSLADYFEETVAKGGEAAEVVTWLRGDIRKLLNRLDLSLTDSPLSPQRLAELLTLLRTGRIHGKIAKQVLSAVFDEDLDPTRIIKEKNWEQITDTGELSPIVAEVVEAHPKEAEAIRSGDSKPMGYLVGQIMRKTGGRAEPRTVQRLLSEQFKVKVVHVLAFGGAISGIKDETGLVAPGKRAPLSQLLGKENAGPEGVAFHDVELGSFLSEEITPADWAALLHAVASYRSHGDTAGIVVAHGTDTLAYTAALLYWAFNKAGTPIVLTASQSSPDAGPEAADNIRAAVARTAGASGVRVAYGNQVFSGLNLRFAGVAKGTARFETWNGELWDVVSSRHQHAVLSADQAAGLFADQEALTEAVEKAMSRVAVVKVYPGIRSDFLIRLINSGIRYFVLELYDSGTAAVTRSPFSLRDALEHGQKSGAQFYCTSQQAGNVDFSEYVTSHELWRSGAVPMGLLSTESVFARLVLGLLACESDDELARFMEIR